eukprot:CAMPEP_0196665426 /NCGR_PEP_ID=MMETSP1086-20130531/61098_1 /TAXON_ID=77921 /ORGANISM="Cyanoptyche  gloeocystis , Strain SAG4.97" /LENGTH=41 /DNA_ID= /DNA_START= /DNA_END= /DNA_ORIENTATION=
MRIQQERIRHPRSRVLSNEDAPEAVPGNPLRQFCPMRMQRE